MNRPTENEDDIAREQSLIRVLLIEDDEDDYLLTREYFDDLERSERFELQWEATYEEGLEALRGGGHDICLVDYRLGARDGVELLRQAIDEGCTTPIIMLTGSGNRKIDRQAMRHGAADYLVKKEITATVLERSIRYSLERHRIMQEQRELAEENKALYEQAQRALEMRDEIQRIVAHDLRGPLNIMGLSVQLMERKIANDADAEEFTEQLETQRHSISRMTRLIQDLLDAAKIEDGSLSLNRSPQPPARIIEAALSQHRIQTEDRSIELSADVADDLSLADADPRRLEQVFANLIGNALKFTPEGGKIELSAHADGHEICFSVRDTGRGIAEDQLPHLFDRFWQADEGADHGAGLGLAICRGIIDAHGGKIWAESTEGEGSTFSFTVPTVTTL